MMILEPTRDALRALRVNVLRSVLTTLGIIIGVAAVIVMVSVGAGAEAKVAELINSLGSNLIYVSPGTTTAGGIRLGTGSLPTTTEDDAEAIQREIPEAQIVSCTVRGVGQVVFGNMNWSTVIYGVTPDYFDAREWEVETGRTFTPEEQKGSGKVAVIGRTVCDNLFPGQDPIGQIIRITRVPVEVVGVLKSKGQSLGGQDLDDAAFVPLSTARKKVLGGRSRSGRLVGSIIIKARSSELVSVVEAQTRDLLRQRHRLRPNQDDDFSIRNLSQVLETQAESSRAMSLLLAAVASVSLVVGGIGIMNIMLVSVTERTREIGLRMAVGARGRDILAQFLTEATALSMIGGCAGILLGVTCALAFTAFGKWPAIIQPASVLMAFSVSAAVGIFFGFYPARKASRLNPIEALRRE
jgi:putative ABC transport system permease protein